MRQVEHPLRWFQPGYLSRRSGVALTDIEFVAVDFETTGLEPREDRIVEVAACRFTADGTIRDEYASRVNPVTARASSTQAFHGLTDAAVRDAPTFGDVWPELARLISGAVVVAHNLAFEDGFLRHELRRIGVDLTGRVPGVCTMVASWSHLEAVSYNQKCVFRMIVGTWPRDAHTALGDVRNLSAIVTGFHRRLPDLRYVGPQPVTLPAAAGRGRMFARPVVEQALRWNSLPMATTDYPLSAAVFRDGVVQLLDARRPGEVLVALMDTAGVGASQFSRELANKIVELIAGGQLRWDVGAQSVLENLMEIMASREFAEILTDGVRDRVPPEGVLAPLLAGKRWQVPTNHPDRETLVDFLTGLGADVLRTRRPALDARVHAGRIHADVVYDLDSYLKDLHRRATEAGPEHLRLWVRQHRQRYPESAGIPLGDRDGGEEWNQRMRFTPVTPERPPNWRWLVDPDDDEPRQRSEVKATTGQSDRALADTQPRAVPAAAPGDERARRATLGHLGRALTALAAKIDGNQVNQGGEQHPICPRPVPSWLETTQPSSQSYQDEASPPASSHIARSDNRTGAWHFMPSLIIMVVTICSWDKGHAHQLLGVLASLVLFYLALAARSRRDTGSATGGPAPDARRRNPLTAR